MLKLVAHCLPFMGRPSEVDCSGAASPVSHEHLHRPPTSSSSLTKTCLREAPSATLTPSIRPHIHIMARPSSSDGLQSQDGTLDSFHVDRRRLDKRISRDDSWIVTGKAGARTRQYVPPRGLPTPDASPISNIIEPNNAPAQWAPMPRNEQIGMALGSPSFATPQWNDSMLRNPKSAGGPVVTSPHAGGSDGISPSAPIPRKGSGKWKIFGMFGRRPVESSSQANSPGRNPNDLPPSSSSRPEFPQTPKSADVWSKPPINRSYTMPSPHDLGKDSKRRPSISKMRKAKTNEATPPMPSLFVDSSDVLDPQDKSSGLLDVSIPSIELERYSVMFEKVLNPSRTSLLSRRQGALEQLKTVDEANEVSKKLAPHQNIRRATSPDTATPARSPSFLLFPQDSTPWKTGQISSHLLSPHSARTRSNTSPAHLPSPTRTTFGQATPEPKSTPVENVPSPIYNHLRDSPQKGKLTIASLARARGDQKYPPRASYFVGGSEPSPIIESPVELDSPPLGPNDSTPTNQSRKLNTQDPSSKQILAASDRQTSPTAVLKAPAASTYSASLSSATASSSSGKHIANSSTSSAQTYRTLNSQISLYTDTDVDETDPMLIGGGRDMTPAEVSIARQISVSRQQRQLLQPKLSIISTHGRAATASPSKTPRAQASPPNGESARMVTPKTATPTLVVPEDLMHSPYVTPLGVARSRKSSRVVIDAT
ncbi:hypothetical protein MN608_05070 [Microdochium nivale]|nr:hypothetical protein MN608_05070 [Microdochium nivale]